MTSTAMIAPLAEPTEVATNACSHASASASFVRTNAAKWAV